MEASASTATGTLGFEMAGSETSSSADSNDNIRTQALSNDMRTRNLDKVEDELERERACSRSNLQSQMVALREFVCPRDGRPWIHSNFANCFFGGVILMNATFIGFETDYNRPDQDDVAASFWLLLESVFLVVFTVELLLRFSAGGLRQLCDSWTVFDLLVLLLGMVDTWLLPFFLAGSSSEMGKVSLFRLLRLVRIVRLLRILRLLRFVRELLLLVRGIAGALRALGWSFLMLAIVLYVSAVFATEIVRDQFRLPIGGGSVEPHLVPIQSWFGSIGASALTLSQLMTLEGWSDVVRITAMEHNKRWLLLFFLPFICCTNFALLNVVTALMVEKIFENAQDEKLQEAKRALRERKVGIHKIMRLFVSLDEDEDGKLSLQQVKDATENQTAMKQFQELGIAKHDIDSLFLCLDVRGKSELTVAEFVEGCLRMHGPATSKDLLRIQYDVHRTWKALDIKKLRRYLEWCVQCLQTDMRAACGAGRTSTRFKTDTVAGQHGRASSMGRYLRGSSKLGPPLEAESSTTVGLSSRSPFLELSVSHCETAPASQEELTVVGVFSEPTPHISQSLSTPTVMQSDPETWAEAPEDGESSAAEDQHWSAGLPAEAQSILEEVVAEQQEMRQLLVRLGEEMRALRCQIHSNSSLVQPLVERAARSSEAVRASKAHENYQFLECEASLSKDVDLRAQATSSASKKERGQKTLRWQIGRLDTSAQDRRNSGSESSRSPRMLRDVFGWGSSRSMRSSDYASAQSTPDRSERNDRASTRSTPERRGPAEHLSSIVPGFVEDTQEKEGG